MIPRKVLMLGNPLFGEAGTERALYVSITIHVVE